MASREIVPASHRGHVAISKISDFFMGWKFCCKPQNTHIKTFATESTEKMCGLHISSDSTWRFGPGMWDIWNTVKKAWDNVLASSCCTSSEGWSLFLWFSREIKDSPRSTEKWQDLLRWQREDLGFWLPCSCPLIRLLASASYLHSYTYTFCN